MTDIREVTGCDDCPSNGMASYRAGIATYCILDDEERATPQDLSTPDWCPLLIAPVTLLHKASKCPECGCAGYQGGSGAAHKLHNAGCSTMVRTVEQLQGARVSQ